MINLAHFAIANLHNEISILDGARAALMALEAKGLYGHSVHAAHVAIGIASILTNCNGKSVPLPPMQDIFHAGLLHDTGKLYISENILNKDSGLSEREIEIIKNHPDWGYKFMLRLSSMQHLAVFVLQHHELPNGKGYPDQLETEQILPLSRVLNISDRFSAMIMNRPYRAAIPPKRAVELLGEDVELFFGSHTAAIKEYLLALTAKKVQTYEQRFSVLHFDNDFSADRRLVC